MEEAISKQQKKSGDQKVVCQPYDTSSFCVIKVNHFCLGII
jgi:hypothetical protein